MYQTFQQTVWDFYQKQGRQTLPWRKTKDPYKIWVSEVMLQQTQVARVIEKYKSFLKKFPTMQSLAEASQSEVLKEWVGLGYNRRALFLKKGAEFVMRDLKGKFPKEVLDLQKIPGIGHYTARAIATFVYNQKHAFIETNIRTVYFNHFFKNKETVIDKEIFNLVQETLPEENFREWYYALMDYGSYLKKEGKGMNARSKHYVKQSKFEGSDRQIRAAIVRHLTQHGKTSFDDILKLPYDEERIEEQIQKLLDEQMVFLKKGFLSLDE
jgi:A/G-specific adenine glycosylase